MPVANECNPGRAGGNEAAALDRDPGVALIDHHAVGADLVKYTCTRPISGVISVVNSQSSIGATASVVQSVTEQLVASSK